MEVLKKIIFQSSIPRKDRMQHDPRIFELGQRHDKRYNKLLREALKAIRLLRKESTSILEVGAGTGLFSEKYVPVFKKSAVVITEPDRLYLEKIPKKFRGYSNIEYVQALTEKFKWPRKFDLILGVEVYHHIPDKKKVVFFRNLRTLLKKSGSVMIGDNFLPQYNPRSPKDRIRALHIFWDPYIREKKRKNDLEGVRTFSQALRQAEEGKVEYKTSTEVFENLLKKVHFSIVYKKTLTQDINKQGGYCIYVLEKV